MDWGYRAGPTVTDIDIGIDIDIVNETDIGNVLESLGVRGNNILSNPISLGEKGPLPALPLRAN